MWRRASRRSSTSATTSGWWCTRKRRPIVASIPDERNHGDVRLDELFVEAHVTDAGRLSLRVGKFASAFGGWIARHLAWDNPMITAPLIYEDVLPMTDRTAPLSAAGVRVAAQHRRQAARLGADRLGAVVHERRVAVGRHRYARHDGGSEERGVVVASGDVGHLCRRL